MLYLRSFCLLVFTVLCFDSNAQQKVDSTYIRSYASNIIIKANLDGKTDAFKVRGDDNLDYQLKATSQDKLYLSLDYEFIGFSLGVAPSFLPDNRIDERKGRSKFTDFQFRFFLGNWTQNLKYSKVIGFYVENTTDFIDNWDAIIDPFIQFPNLTVTSYAGSTAYVLNSEKFSLRNVVYNTEWQLKSVGSFVPELFYSYSTLEATLENQRLKDQLYDVGVSARYYYSFVWRENWFISANMAPSLSLRFIKSEDSLVAGVTNNSYYPVGISGNVQLGYSSHRWIFGASYEYQSTNYKENRATQITNNLSYAKIYIGYRLDTPGFVSSIFKKVNKSLGL